MNQFVKALNVKGDCFQFICTTFPGLSYDKIKAGVFDGTQIKKFMKCQNFSSSMSDVERHCERIFREYKGCKLQGFGGHCLIAFMF